MKVVVIPAPLQLFCGDSVGSLVSEETEVTFCSTSRIWAFSIICLPFFPSCLFCVVVLFFDTLVWSLLQCLWFCCNTCVWQELVSWLCSQTSWMPGDEIVFPFAQIAQLDGMLGSVTLSLKSRIKLPLIFMRRGKASCKPVALCTVFLHFWPGKCVAGWCFITCP